MKKPAPLKPSPGIVIAIPSIIDKKMEAIVELSKAIHGLSRALESAHINASVVGNTIVGAKGNAIQIGSAE